MSKIRRIIAYLFIMLMAVILINSCNFSMAATGSKRLGLYGSGNGRPTGYYTTGTKNSSKVIPVIKIIEYNDTGTAQKTETESEAIYCLKDGVGFANTTTGTATTVNYTQYFDMRNPDGMGTYKNALPQTTANYKKLMWLLDNLCIPEDADSVNTLLAKAGLEKSDFTSYMKSNTDKTFKDVIEIIQQAAIWYITNNGDSYQPSQYSTFAVSTTNSGTGTNLEDKLNMDIDGNAIMDLYDYLISEPQSHSTYDYTQQGQSAISFDTSRAKIDYSGSYILVGPYRVTASSNDYTGFSAKVYNNNSEITSATIIKGSSKVSGTNTTAKIKSTIGSDFYIQLPYNTTASIKIEVKANTEVKNLTYWSTAASTMNANQPIVVIEKQNKPYSNSDTKSVTEPKTQVTVQKAWNDDNNNARPTSVTVELFADGKTTNQTATLNSGNNWKHTFSNLSIKTSTGKNIVYTVQEQNIPEGYTAKVTKTSDNNFTITNTHKEEKTEVTVKKSWKDSKNKESIRPDSITVELLKNGEPFNHEATLNSANGWQYTFEDLDLKEGDTNIKYTVQEKNTPEGYTASVSGNAQSGFTITNTHKIFDLALRKYITKVNGKLLNEQNIALRNPNIDKTTLSSGTTATYEHKKDPVLVKTGDTVTYSITIYNEGEKNGYASQITDQLPTGLVCTSTGNVTSKGKDGANKNTYRISYNSGTNKVVLDIVNSGENTAKALNAYDTDLDYETIELNCRVDYEAKFGAKNILTNTAWISADYDSEAGKAGEDIDSQPTANPSVDKDSMEDYKGKDTNPTDLSNNEHFYEGEQDDDDFEKVYVKMFDLSLRKFITAVNEKELSTNGVYDRAPVVDTTPLINESDTASYKHTKSTVSVAPGDTVTYTIRVYNEGEVDGYAEEIVDHLPPELEFLPNDDLNKKYLWTLDSEDESGRTVKTTYLSKEENEKGNIIKGFNGGSTLSYKDIQIRCKVKEGIQSLKKITNIAEITESNNENGIPDRDNEEKVKLPTDPELPDYKGKETNPDDLTDKDEYYEGQEDDDDFEKLIVEKFDLALRKFITGVNDEEVTTRVPRVDTTKYGTIVDGKEVTDMEYTHPKDPVRVANNDIVIYTIRVYNEGTKSGYASEIKDDLPEGLEYIPDNEINQQYGWVLYDAEGKVTEDVSNAVEIRTTYLSKDNETEAGEFLLKAFNPEEMETPDYKDVQIAFRVTEPNTSDRILTNKAEISKDTDENGDDVDDIDSTPDKWIDEDDDQDVEHVYVKYFDLALRKWVSQVILIEDGVQKEMDTGHYAEQDPEPAVKVELNKKRIENTIVKFRYQIRITNEGEIEGYATEISDYIPEGLTFNQADNPKWREENGKIVTDQLKDTLLQPGEQVTIDVVLTWINDENNLNLKTNVAEISDDDNPSDSPDIDSTPNNKKPGEDDIDDAPVILTIVTGIASKYIFLIAGTIMLIGTGALTIKKYVV